VGANASKADQSEDCLHLNIYKPVGASASDNLPVMLWIHGGAYVTGESNDYSGQAIVENSKGAAIVVVINYRLNVFGFLGSNEINISTAGGGAGNFGIQDQVRLKTMLIA
jgi:para-nitrobenzyl esterase